MIEIGKYQELTVVNKRDHGIYLAESADADMSSRVLLPTKQIPEGTQPGDRIRVFVYRDSNDRLIATTAKPLLALHEVAVLEVAETTPIGAFLSWGLEKDLLLPFHEQTRRVAAGERVLAALYEDKSGRLAATMKIYPYLRTDSPYHTGDSVTGTVYQLTDSFGVFVAVDGIFSGLIPKKEAQGRFTPGDELKLRVTRVREDGKLDLSPHEKVYLQMDIDAEAVLACIRDEYHGELPFDDKADPERIKEEFGLSKAAFKRAVGRLYKEHKIVIEGGRIRTV
ncbi:MAG: S1-like domain-containing RNA-binding protein [Lachnospiraceae bacterium]|nr:S1-like domain-containing RNA-binding protein [Lachnospiraceae bacterium]